MSVYLGARMDGSFYNSCYGSPNSADVPFAGSTDAGAALESFTAHAGKQPTFAQWGGSASAWPPLSFDATAAGRLDAEGMFSMYDWGTTLAGLNDLLANNATAHSYIGTLAQQMKDFGRPILFRPFWEMNGNWFAWGRQNFTAAQYVTIWRNLWQIFADVMGGHTAGSGLGTDTGNVSFFWCPNNYGGTIPDPTAYDPGAPYRDALGWDGYIGTAHYGTTYKTPDELYGDIYDVCAALDTDLPIVIGEWGVGADLAAPGKDGFFTAMLDPTTGWVAAHPRIVGLNYFNDNTYEATANKSLCFEQDSTGCPVGTTAPETAFATAIADSMYAANVVDETTFPSNAKVPFDVTATGSGGTAGTGGTGAGGTGRAPDAVPIVVNDFGLTIKIFDLQTVELADITDIALEKQLVRNLNQARSFILQARADDPLLTTVADDGYPNLRRGNRKLLVWEDGQIIFHGRIWITERVGDGTRNRVTITAFDPWMELGYEAEDRAGRPVRGSTAQPTAGAPFDDYDGNFINPKFASSVAGQDGISGPDLIYQALTNSQNTGTESDPAPGEGELPIDLTTGTFDLDVPPAVDLSCIDDMDWPVQIGDFINRLVETNVVDVDMRPVDPSEGLDPYVMAALSAVSSQGVDRSPTVHFDYWTGSKNAKQCRHVSDFSTICNKLYDNLGPRLSKTRWRGLIAPHSPETAPAVGDAVDASRTLYGGEFMSIRIFDSVGSENSSRPLYDALYNAEALLRAEPRETLYITPNDGSAALFDAPSDFDVGDVVAINIGADFGLALAETQRVYGYTKTWTREGVAQLGQLVTSADIE